MPFTETLTTIIDGDSSLLRRELQDLASLAEQVNTTLRSLNQTIIVDTSQAIANLQALMQQALATAAALQAVQAAGSGGGGGGGPLIPGGGPQLGPRPPLGPEPLNPTGLNLGASRRTETYLRNRRG